jgi:hypothetical protein
VAKNSWNSALHPRWPKGSGDKSGEFVGRNSSGGGSREVDSLLRSAARPPESFRDFVGDIEAAEDWGEEKWRAWRDSLTGTEDRALYEYGNFSYANINAGLRSGGTLSETIQKDVKAIDSALNKSKVPENVSAFRGLYHSEIANAFADGDSGRLVGMEFQDDGFISTSLDANTAYRHSRADPDSALARIYVPEGSRGAYVDPVTQRGEAELLLPRGTRFRVREAFVNAGGTPVVRLEVV